MKLVFSRIALGYNARKAVGDVVGLADSIRADGLIQPLVVRMKGENDPELVAGYRRHAAIVLLREEARKAGQPLPFESVECRIYEGTDLDATVANIAENTNRNDLSILDQGRAYRKLRDEHRMPVVAIAKRLGISHSQVSNAIAAAERLHPAAQKLIDKGMPIPVSKILRWCYQPQETQKRELDAWLGEQQGAEKTRRTGKRAPSRGELRRIMRTLPPENLSARILSWVLGEGPIPPNIEASRQTSRKSPKRPAVSRSRRRTKSRKK